MGETLLLSFQCIFEIVNKILPNLLSGVKETLVQIAFNPVLSTLRHYLERLPGSPNITRQSLKGYAQLANLCMPSRTTKQALQRRACLSSLCSLSLPSHGKQTISR